jgi:DNA-3-methyladenine glycosylase
MSIATRRVYEPRSGGDGYRVLVDRLWPRGLSRQAAQIDLWLRDIAPSTALRKWYSHLVDRWPEFRERYLVELEGHTELLDLLQDLERHHGAVTLLFAARDEAHNEAAVIADALRIRPAHSHS